MGAVWKRPRFILDTCYEILSFEVIAFVLMLGMSACSSGFFQMPTPTPTLAPDEGRVIGVLKSGQEPRNQLGLLFYIWLKPSSTAMGEKLSLASTRRILQNVTDDQRALCILKHQAW
jgi:hypothetical protein